jgi:hypothetical protein
VTIATHTPVHQRTLADTQAQVGYENVHHLGLRTWLRDEGAAGSHPATPTQVMGPLAIFAVAFLDAVQRGVQQRLLLLGGARQSQRQSEQIACNGVRRQAP